MTSEINTITLAESISKELSGYIRNVSARIADTIRGFGFDADTAYHGDEYCIDIWSSTFEDCDLIPKPPERKGYMPFWNYPASSVHFFYNTSNFDGTYDENFGELEILHMLTGLLEWLSELQEVDADAVKAWIEENPDTFHD